MKLYKKFSLMDPFTILKVFGTGQITIPKKWRDQFKTDHYKAVKKGKKIILSPIEETEKNEDDGKWITFFDADEFNSGKGVEIGVFYEALKKSLEKD